MCGNMWVGWFIGCYDWNSGVVFMGILGGVWGLRLNCFQQQVSELLFLLVVLLFSLNGVL